MKDAVWGLVVGLLTGLVLGLCFALWRKHVCVCCRIKSSSSGSFSTRTLRRVSNSVMRGITRSRRRRPAQDNGSTARRNCDSLSTISTARSDPPPYNFDLPFYSSVVSSPYEPSQNSSQSRESNQNSRTVGTIVGNALWARERQRGHLGASESTPNSSRRSSIPSVPSDIDTAGSSSGDALERTFDTNSGNARASHGSNRSVTSRLESDVSADASVGHQSAGSETNTDNERVMTFPCTSRSNVLRSAGSGSAARTDGALVRANGPARIRTRNSRSNARVSFRSTDSESDNGMPLSTATPPVASGRGANNDSFVLFRRSTLAPTNSGPYDNNSSGSCLVRSESSSDTSLTGGDSVPNGSERFPLYGTLLYVRGGSHEQTDGSLHTRY